MRRPDHSTYREWLNLDADGELPPAQRAQLDEHLATCAECRSERDEMLAFERLLASNRVPVRSDFRDQVLASLPAAGWESRAPRTWSFPAAVVVLLAGIAAALLGSTRVSSSSSVLSTLSAVGGMLQATLQAGAGLLAASWKGAGLVFAETLSSPMSLGVFAFLVICLNLLLISLVRRRRPGVREAPVAEKRT
jgi:anti-sigma factor RsiW